MMKKSTDEQESLARQLREAISIFGKVNYLLDCAYKKHIFRTNKNQGVKELNG